MSSIRKAAPRRTHRERAQPSARSNLGLLEKHKDYVKRAKDFHKKEKALKILKEKATFRNPDEFYFGMVNAKTNKGVHTLQRTETFDHELKSLMKTQDQNYINYQRSINLKKIKRLQEDIHFVEEDKEESDKEDSEDNEKNSMSDFDEPEPVQPTKKLRKSGPSHTIFVDDKAQAKSFDSVSYFETVPELVNKPFNRLRKSTLEKVEIPSITPEDAAYIAKQKDAAAAELSTRMQREESLRKVQLELQLQKNLMGKGARKKIGVDSLGLPKYKWKSCRQK